MGRRGHARVRLGRHFLRRAAEAGGQDVSRGCECSPPPPLHVNAPRPRSELANNGLTGVLPESLGTLTAATSINLRGNSIGGTLPGTIGGITGLEALVPR